MAGSPLVDARVVPRVDGGDDAEPDPWEAPAQCTSGEYLGMDGPITEAMTPGRPCNKCHDESNQSTGGNDAPIFGFAGTVYSSGHELDDCVALGVLGATVEVIDAKGKKIVVKVLKGGNFQYGPSDFALPYTARLTMNGRTSEMVQPVWDGDCNGCHSQKGDWLKPPPGVTVKSEDPPRGRLVLP